MNIRGVVVVCFKCCPVLVCVPDAFYLKSAGSYTAGPVGQPVSFASPERLEQQDGGTTWRTVLGSHRRGSR